MSFLEDNKEDILALALSNAATDTNTVHESSTGLLDFFNIEPTVDNSILPAHPLAVTTTVDTMVDTAPLPPMPHEDNLMDMLGLTDDKLDTISNNELDSLLEEASKIEVPKEVEMAFNSPSIVDSSKEFKLPQHNMMLSQASSPLVPTTSVLKPLPNATRLITVQPVATNRPNSVNKVITGSSIAASTANKAPITVTPSVAGSSVASKFSVTEAFKALGATSKPLVNLKGQQLINLLNSSIVNTTIVSSSSLNIPVLSLASTSRATSTSVTTTDRRYRNHY